MTFWQSLTSSVKISKCPNQVREGIALTFCGILMLCAFATFSVKENLDEVSNVESIIILFAQGFGFIFCLFSFMLCVTHQAYAVIRERKDVERFQEGRVEIVERYFFVLAELEADFKSRRDLVASVRDFNRFVRDARNDFDLDQAYIQVLDSTGRMIYYNGVGLCSEHYDIFPEDVLVMRKVEDTVMTRCQRLRRTLVPQETYCNLSCRLPCIIRKDDNYVYEAPSDIDCRIWDSLGFVFPFEWLSHLFAFFPCCWIVARRVSVVGEDEEIYLVNDYMTIGGSKWRKEKKGIFNVVDGNPLNNIEYLRKLPSVHVLLSKKRFQFKLRGSTHCDRGLMHFPVYCDKKQFLSCVMPDVMLLTKEEWIDFSSGILTMRNVHLFDRCLSPIIMFEPRYGLTRMCSVQNIVKPSFSSLFLDVGLACAMYWYADFNFLSLFLIHCSIVRVLSFVFDDARIGLALLTLLAPFTEEFVKPYVGFTFFGFLEVVTKVSSHKRFSTSMCWAFVMHIITGYYSFWPRVLIHMSWNVFVLLEENYDLLCTSVVDYESQLKSVEDVAKLMDLFRKLFQKDAAGMVLSIMGDLRWVFRICEIVGIKDGSFDLWHMIPEVFMEAGSITALGPESPSYVQSFIDRMRKILPRWIAHSPIYSKLASLVIVLSSSSMLYSSAAFRGVSKYFDFSDLSPYVETIEPLTLVFGIMKGVYRGCVNVYETGNWRDFFDLPKDVYFMVESAKYVHKMESADKPEKILSEIAAANRLISDRLYLVNPPPISKRLEDLHRFVNERTSFYGNCEVRVAPFVVWLNGPPGTGKTTLIENIMTYFANMFDLERFHGDTIFYNIWDKFAVSTGAHKDALFVVMNDITDNYKEFPKMDLMSLDVLLQRIIDTSPLDFRSAAVEDKGKMFNKVVLLIITSNHESYVFPGETEKLQRRLEPGLVVDVTVRKEGKVLKFKQFSSFGQAERNACWNFNVMTPSCAGNHVTFHSTALNLNFPAFTNYLRSKALSYIEKVSIEKKKFFDRASGCACGCAIEMHRMPAAPGFYELTNPHDMTLWGSDMWVDLSPKCAAFLKDYNDEVHLTNYRMPYKDVTNLGFNQRSISFMFSSLILITFWYFLEDWRPLFLSIPICYIISFVDDYATPQTLETAKVAVIAAAESTVTNVFGEVAFKFELESRKFFLMFKRWCRTKLYQILAIVGISGAGMFLKYLMFKNVSVEGLANPIFLKDVEPDSMIATNRRQEASFDPVRVRQWGKQEGSTFNRVDLMTVGTSLDSLTMIVRNQLLKTIVLIESAVGNQSIAALILVISNDFFVINRHYLFENSSEKVRGHRFTIYLKGDPFTFYMKDMLSHNSCEWVMFRHSLPFLAKNLVAYFPEEMCNFSCDVRRVSPDSEHNTVCSPSFLVFGDHKYVTVTWKDALGKGDCMSVLLARFNQSVGIIGFLFAGENGSIVGGSWTKLHATLCSRKVFSELVSPLVEPLVGDSTFLGSFSNIKMSAVDEHSDLRNVDNSCIEVIGTENGSTSHFKSSYQKSRWFPYFSSKLSESYDFPKKESGVCFDGNYYSALGHTLGNFGKGDDFPVDLGIECAESYLEDCFPVEFVREKNLRATPLLLSEAIFGVPELNVCRINFKTSCGPTLRERGIRNKFDLFGEGVDQKFLLDPLFVSNINGCFSRWDSGVLTIPVGEFVGKDEIRPVKKLEINKVRLFCNMDADFNTGARMLLIVLIQMYLAYPQRTECYGGMNAGSSEWDEFANWILHEDFLQLDSDFRTFDSSHGLKAFRVAAYFVYILAKRLGYNDLSSYECYVLIRSVAIQVIRYKKTWFLKFGGLPSGFILTLVINSIINSILMRMAFSVLVGNVKDFKNKVRVGTVGDDNASGVSKSIASLFNLRTIAPLYARWGYEVTTAQKGDDLPEFVDPVKLQFVKRKFVYNADLKGYCAPIDKDSIYKSLCYEDKKMSVSPAQRLVDVALGAQREAFLHGKDFFLSFQEELRVACVATEMVVEMLDYDLLVTEYLENRFSTFQC